MEMWPADGIPTQFAYSVWRGVTPWHPLLKSQNLKSLQSYEILVTQWQKQCEV